MAFLPLGKPGCELQPLMLIYPIMNASVHQSHLSRITSDPSICGGKPCIRGQRIRVKDVIELLAAGASHEEILTDYPYLEVGDILASLEYAALQMDHPVVRIAAE
jgi:uncharacterized protein (DUF433 family)